MQTATKKLTLPNAAQNVLESAKTRELEKEKFQASLLSKTMIQGLFDVMGQMFGSRWASTYGESDTGEVWRAGLKGLDEQSIKTGLNRIVDEGGDWPPSLPEFRKLCQEPKREQSAFGGAHKPLPVGLPEPKEYVSKRKLRGRSRMKDLLAQVGSTKYAGEC